MHERELIHYARELGALDPTSIWALVCVVLVGYIWYLTRQTRRSGERWQKIRSEEAVSDMKMADALQKLADNYQRLSVIVDERIPRRP